MYVEVYVAHPLNFFVLRSLSIFESQLQVLPSLPIDLQRLVLKTFEFVATVLSLVPMRELAALNQFITTCQIDGAAIAIIFETIVKLVSFDVRFKSAIRKSGLLMSIVEHLYWYTSNEAPAWVEQAFDETDSAPPAITFVHAEQLPLVLEALEAVVRGCKENVLLVKNFGASKLFPKLIVHPKTRAGAFRLLQSVVRSDMTSGSPAEIALLLKMLAVIPDPHLGSAPDMLKLPLDVLGCLRKLCCLGFPIQRSFGQAGGIACLVEFSEAAAAGFCDSCIGHLQKATRSEIEGLDRWDSTGPSLDETDHWLARLEGYHATLVAAMQHNIENQAALTQLDGHNRLVAAVVENDLLEEGCLQRVLNMWMDLATGRSDNTAVESLLIDTDGILKLPIVEPQVGLMMIKLLPSLPMQQDRDFVLGLVDAMAEAHSGNRESLCLSGMATHILKNYAPTLDDENDPDHNAMLSILCQICAFRVEPQELRKLLSLVQKPKSSMSPKMQSKPGSPGVPGRPSPLSPLISVQLKRAASRVSEPLVSALYRMACDESVPACEFNLYGQRHAGLSVTRLSTSPDFLLSDFSFSMWVNVGEGCGSLLPLYTFTAANGDTMSGCIRNGHLQLSSNTNSQPHAITMKHSMFMPEQWYHVVVVVKKSLLAASTATAFINGLMCQTGKHPCAGLTADTQLFVGHNGEACPGIAMCWQLGPIHLFSRPLNSDSVLQLYLKGPAYSATLSSENSRSDLFLQSPACAKLTEALLSTASLRALRTIDAAAVIDKKDERPADAQLHSSPRDVVLSFHPRTLQMHSGIDHLATARLKIPATKQSLLVMPNSALLGEFAQNSDLSVITASTAAWLLGDVKVLQPVPLSETIRSAGGLNFCLSLAVLAHNPTLLAVSIQFLAELLTGNLKNLQATCHLCSAAVTACAAVAVCAQQL